MAGLCVENPDDSGLVRTIVNRQRRKLGNDTKNPAYIFAEPRDGYQMPQCKGQGELVGGRQLENKGEGQRYVYGPILLTVHGYGPFVAQLSALY